jgi:exonuclease III
MNGNHRHLSILTLNVNGLNGPVKRYRRANWVKNQDPTILLISNSSYCKKINTG